MADMVSDGEIQTANTSIHAISSFKEWLHGYSLRILPKHASWTIPTFQAWWLVELAICMRSPSQVPTETLHGA